MKYVKTFENHRAYEDYTKSEEYLTPNLSYCVAQNEPHYQKYIDPSNGHEYVDLGLESGTLWATMNVGATSNSDYGLYFQWGDSQGYESNEVGVTKNFTWSDYKWTEDDGSTFTKYEYTFEPLEPEDDAASVAMGGKWHVPTNEQITELFALTHSVTTIDSVSGMMFTGTNNNTLFIPFAGYADNGQVYSAGFYADIWSNEMGSEASQGSYGGMNSSNIQMYAGDKRYGLSVRGVLSGSASSQMLQREAAAEIPIGLDEKDKEEIEKEIVEKP